MENDEIHMDSEEIDSDYRGIDYEEVVQDIESHDASHLIICDRNPVNGYVTFTFYQADNCVGKMTFDELSEDTAFRAKAVLDYLSTVQHVVIDQVEIEEVWDNAGPVAVHSPGYC